MVASFTATFGFVVGGGGLDPETSEPQSGGTGCKEA